MIDSYIIPCQFLWYPASSLRASYVFEQLRNLTRQLSHTCVSELDQVVEIPVDAFGDIPDTLRQSDLAFDSLYDSRMRMRFKLVVMAVLVIRV